MDQTKKSQAEDRNAQVRAVLLAASEPLGPSEVARRVGKTWCNAGAYPSSAAVTPVLRRIGAVGVKGKYTLKADGA
jgi:hypothetical protein